MKNKLSFYIKHVIIDYQSVDSYLTFNVSKRKFGRNFKMIAVTNYSNSIQKEISNQTTSIIERIDEKCLLQIPNLPEILFLNLVMNFQQIIK